MITDEIKKDWINLVSKYIEKKYNIYIYNPNEKKHMLISCNPEIEVDVNIIDTYTRSSKINISFFNENIETIVYYPTNKSLEFIFNNIENKISDIVNDKLKSDYSDYVDNIWDELKLKYDQKINNIISEIQRKNRKIKIKNILYGN